MTLGIINNGVKDLGFGTHLSQPRPAGTIIDEIIGLHKASERDPNKPKVTLPRLEKIDRISFEIEGTPVDVCWGTTGYDYYGEDDYLWNKSPNGVIACLISPESPAAKSDDELLTQTITKVMARILAKTSGLEIIAEMDYYHEAKEA